MGKKRQKRFHVIVVREDGKLVHNRVLEWLHIRKHVTVFGSLLGGLALGTLAFFLMVAWHGNLVARNVALAKQERALRSSLLDLGKSLDETRTLLSQSQKQLSGIEDLARAQNLKIRDSAGLGGPSANSPAAMAPDLPIPDPAIRNIALGISELKEQTGEVARETESVSKILVPHLQKLSKTPTIWPVKGFVGSNFGGRPDPIRGHAEFHEGIDICAPYGSPVQASADGLVVFAGWKSGYGHTIEISHESGLLTRYGHLSKILVKPGQQVKRWQKIGAVGTSGRTTGSHLHYEVRRDDRPLNPKQFILF